METDMEPNTTETTYPKSEKTQAQIDSNFRSHDLDEDQAGRCQQVRELFRQVAEYVCAKTPPSREQSLALTKLEEAMFWANAAIARGIRPE